MVVITQEQRSRFSGIRGVSVSLLLLGSRHLDFLPPLGQLYPNKTQCVSSPIMESARHSLNIIICWWPVDNGALSVKVTGFQCTQN